MNMLKRMILGVILASNTAALCGEINGNEKTNKATEEVTNSYNYWGIGAGIPTFLSAKFGHREQKGHGGFEYGVGVTPLVYVTEAHIFASALYYPKPNLKRQTYLGAGIKAGGFLEMNRAKFAYIGPGFLIGRERLVTENQRQFTQIAFGVGALTSEGASYFPSISLTFGYAF